MVNLVAGEDEDNLMVPGMFPPDVCRGAPSVCACHSSFCAGGWDRGRAKGEREAVCCRQSADDLVLFRFTR